MDCCLSSSFNRIAFSIIKSLFVYLSVQLITSTSNMKTNMLMLSFAAWNYFMVNKDACSCTQPGSFELACRVLNCFSESCESYVMALVLSRADAHIVSFFILTELLAMDQVLFNLISHEPRYESYRKGKDIEVSKEGLSPCSRASRILFDVFRFLVIIPDNLSSVVDKALKNQLDEYIPVGVFDIQSFAVTIEEEKSSRHEAGNELRGRNFKLASTVSTHVGLASIRTKEVSKCNVLLVVNPVSLARSCQSENCLGIISSKKDLFGEGGKIC
eukprot:759274-Hanusia_phi.AAC.5